jgi:bacillithiol biosynthesis deacetylase BshB1
VLPTRVLAIGAHPDDVEILCGGTLARFTETGAHVVICSVTNGNRGSRGQSMDELAGVRKAEGQAAADVIGATFWCLDIDDCGVIYPDESMRRTFIDAIRKHRPELVLTHDPQDYHSDHVSTSRHAVDATFMASIPSIETGSKPYNAIVPVYYFDTLLGIDFQPELYVDVSGAVERKREMLSKHVSQLGAIRAGDPTTLLDQMETQTRLRGMQSGVRYAEAFRPARAWLRGSTERLLP